MRQREHRVREVGRGAGLDAVRLEQAAHDARLDVRVRAEDDRERLPADDRVQARPSLNPALHGPREEVVELHQDHRHVVVLRRAGHERLDLPQDPLAQLVGRQVAVLLDELRQPRLAEQVASRRSSPR